EITAVKPGRPEGVRCAVGAVRALPDRRAQNLRWTGGSDPPRPRSRRCRRDSRPDPALSVPGGAEAPARPARRADRGALSDAPACTDAEREGRARSHRGRALTRRDALSTNDCEMPLAGLVTVCPARA